MGRTVKEGLSKAFKEPFKKPFKKYFKGFLGLTVGPNLCNSTKKKLTHV